PEIVELAAAVMCFRHFSRAIDIVTDFAYIAGIVTRLEGAYLKEVLSPHLFALLKELQYLLNHRTAPYFVIHFRSHTNLLGPVAEGNKIVDLLASMVQVPDLFQQAHLSCEFYHQSAQTLQHLFKLYDPQASQIIAACPDCASVTSFAPLLGVNPRGLCSLELWQTDVTHMPDFGCLKYVHVSINTFSGAIVATVHTGEKAKDVQRHWLSAFVMLGVPQCVKSDNGPAYISAMICSFMQTWGVCHVTSIPPNLTIQDIVECAHNSLKTMLLKQ
ncbi:hypothetical protein N300_05790, partial [Calypte anna]